MKRNIYKLFFACAFFLSTLSVLGQAPVATAYSPIDNTSGVSVSTQLVLTFDKVVRINNDIPTASTSRYIRVQSFYFNEEEGINQVISTLCEVSLSTSGVFSVSGCSINIDKTNSSNSLTIVPSISMNPNTQYRVVISNEMIEETTAGVDFAGFTNFTTWNFTTGAAPTPPSITAYSPTKDSTNVALFPTIRLTFNEDVIPVADGSIKIINSVTGLTHSNFDNTQLTVVNNKVSFTPSSPLLEGVLYYVTVPATILKSTATNAFFAGIDNSANNNYRFTTLVNAPVTSMTPNGSGVSLYPTIVISFSKPARLTSGADINASNVKNLILSFTAPGHTVAPSDYDATISADKKTITLYLRNSLNSGLTYTVVVDKVEDANGTEQLAAFSEDFDCSGYNVWTGSMSSDFADPLNFSEGYNSSIGVLINSGLSVYPVIDSDITLHSLIMEPGTALTVNSGKTLNITGSFDLIGDNSTIGQPSFLNFGTLTVGADKIKFRQRVSSYSYDYYFASPITGSRLTVGDALYQRTYDPYGWSSIGVGASLSIGTGYVSYSTAGTDLVMAGSGFNNSQVVINTAPLSSTNFGWYLAGNPFPAAIDWRDLTKSQLRDRFYIAVNGSTGWGTYNVVEGTAADINLSGLPYSIPPFHAFYIQSDYTLGLGTSGSLTIPASAQRLASNNYMKSASNLVQNPVVKLVAKSGTYSDEAALVYNLNGSLARVSSDASKMLSSSANILNLFVLTSGGDKIAIKSAPLLDEWQEIIVPIGYDAPKSGTYSIGISSLTDLPDGSCVLLEDKTNQTKNDLRLGDYSFSVTSTGVNINRFNLHVIAGAATNAPVTSSQLVLKVIAEKNKVTLLPNPTVENGTFEIIDNAGKVFVSGNVDQLYSGLLIDTTGVFILRIKSDNQIYTEKILLRR